MTPTEFEARLRRDGFTEILTATREPGEISAAHAHDYDVHAIVLDGDITLIWDGDEHRYAAGDTFRMAAGKTHAERVGAQGIRYLAGRKRR